MPESSDSALHFNYLVMELNAWCECRSPNLSESYIRRPLNGHHLYLMFGVLSITLCHVTSQKSKGLYSILSYL